MSILCIVLRLHIIFHCICIIYSPIFINKYQIFICVCYLKMSLQFVKTELASTVIGERFAERLGGFVPMEMVIKGLLFNVISWKIFHGRIKLPFLWEVFSLVYRLILGDRCILHCFLNYYYHLAYNFERSTILHSAALCFIYF